MEDRVSLYPVYGDKFSNLINKYSIEQIIDMLFPLFYKNEKLIPFHRIKEEYAIYDFKKLRELKLFDVLSIIENNNLLKYRYDSKYNFLPLYFKAVDIGSMASNFIFERMRWKAVNKSVGISPYDVFFNEKALKKVLYSVLKINRGEISPNVIREILRINQYIVTQFRPSVAKILYDLFQAEDVFDFSMGWGDRLAGALASNTVKSYTGVDPNSLLHPLYERENKLYNFENKKIKFICSGSEDIWFPANSFDFIFSSPPYFNREIYNNENTQSYSKFPNYENWFNNYLCKTLYKSWRCLKEGGYLAININNIANLYKKGVNICNDMNDYISKLPDAKYFGAIGYQLRISPNLINVDRSSIFVEPIFIWNKEKKIKVVVKGSTEGFFDNFLN